MSDSEMVDFTKETAQETNRLVEQFLRNYLYSTLKTQEVLMGIVEQCLVDIGLRIRPFLLRVSCQTGKIDFKHIASIAAGVELIQLSTLVIDDALDESPLRNNKASIFAQRGTKETFTVGAIMSSLGFSLIAEGMEKVPNLKNKVFVINLLAQTHSEIYIGQFLDLHYAGDVEVSESKYFDMIFKTTARFIQTPLVAGAMMWDACPEIITVLEKAGLALGMAYQLRDDVLDVIGDSECTGKPIGGDVRQCKMRLPMIRALRELDRVKGQRFVGLLKTTNPSDESISEALTLIKETDAIDYCISKTKDFCEQAIGTINMLSEDYTSLKAHFCVISNLISSFEDRT